MRRTPLFSHHYSPSICLGALGLRACENQLSSDEQKLGDFLPS